MITFYKKTQAQYDALATYVQDGIYFISDSKVIYLNGVRYGTNINTVTEFPATGLVGIIYVNSDTLEQRIYSNNAWITIAPPKVKTITSSSSDGQIPTSKAVYDYVVNAISSAGLGIGGRLHPAVQTVDGLKAIADIADKDLILVEDAGSLYRYDEQSTDTADDLNVITPNSGNGRWIKMFVQITYTEGNGIDISSNNQITLNINTETFEFDAEGKLSLKAAAIASKMDVVDDATENNIATWNNNGMVKDSGKKIGGAMLAEVPDTDTVATEKAVEYALSFK